MAACRINDSTLKVQYQGECNGNETASIKHIQLISEINLHGTQKHQFLTVTPNLISITDYR